MNIRTCRECGTTSDRATFKMGGATICNKCNYRKYKYIWARSSKERYERTKDAERDKRRERWNDWYRRNPHMVRARDARHRARRYAATVAWGCPDKITEMYAEARRLTSLTGIRHHVDHIVPLKSAIVCGLHWEGNLQVLPIAANSAKGNRWWPDMPGAS